MKKTYGNSNPVSIEITGAESLEEIFDKLPKKFAKKPLIAALRKGAREFTKDLKSVIPLQGAKKAVGTKAGKGNVAYVMAGILSGKVNVTLNDGKQYDVYTPLYWLNFGTGANRNSSHVFQKKRKAVSAGWKGGIKPLGFVQNSWSRTETRTTKVVEDDFKVEIMKVIDKYAVK